MQKESRVPIIVLIFVGLLLAMNFGVVANEKLIPIFPVAVIVVTLLTRVTVSRLPKFLE